MNENIADRISFLVTVCGDGKNTVFANRIGDNEANIRNYRSGKTTPKYSTLVNIVNYCGVNTQWIMTGKGVPFKRSSPFFESNPVSSTYGARVVEDKEQILHVGDEGEPISSVDDLDEMELKRQRAHETLKHLSERIAAKYGAHNGNSNTGADTPVTPTDETATPDALIRIKFLEETNDRKESQIAEINREIGRLRHILTTHNIDPNAQD